MFSLSYSSVSKCEAYLSNYEFVEYSFSSPAIIHLCHIVLRQKEIWSANSLRFFFIYINLVPRINNKNRTRPCEQEMCQQFMHFQSGHGIIFHEFEWSCLFAYPCMCNLNKYSLILINRSQFYSQRRKVDKWKREASKLLKKLHTKSDKVRIKIPLQFHKFQSFFFTKKFDANFAFFSHSKIIWGH